MGKKTVEPQQGPLRRQGPTLLHKILFLESGSTGKWAVGILLMATYDRRLVLMDGRGSIIVHFDLPNTDNGCPTFAGDFLGKKDG